MSQWRGRFEETDFGAALEYVERWYQVPALVVLLGFMFWLRTRNWSRFVRDGQVLLDGNDPWYHLRTVSYTVRNWPETMPFDTWTYFPYGNASSQFGTLFDQLIATAALVVGLGNPDQSTVAMTVLFAPAVFGTLTAIPVYLAGKRLGGRLGGLTSVLVLALSTSSFFGRTTVGFADHHAGEAFFQMVAVLGLLAAVSVATAEKPVWELVSAREISALRRPLGWAALSGVAVGLYVWVWPPAVLLFGILGLYFLVELSIEVAGGYSPEHVAFAGAVALLVAGVLALLPMNSLELSALEFSLLQPLLAFAVAAGCVFLAWFARQWERRDLERLGYPAAVLVLLGATVGLFALLAPDLYDYFVKNTLRVVGFATGDTAGTVGEATPFARPRATLFSRYGAALITAGGAVLLIAYEQVRGERPRPDLTLVVVWGVVLLLGTLTQSRFDYYLVLPVAVLNGYLVGVVADVVSVPGDVTELETFQVLTVLAVLLVIVVPFTLGGATVVDHAGVTGPSGGIPGWDEPLEWTAENTPEEGNYAGAGNQDQLEYYGTYARTDDFDYPPGAYGVLSWWDYGHWITTRGERIPNANPFQQGASDAANFLLAPNETRANEVVAGMAEDDAETRYVMVDWKMANTWGGQVNGKFFAPIVFYNDAEVTQRDFFHQVFRVQNNQPRSAYMTRSQRYYESMVIRLWHFHGSAAEPQPIVVDYEERTVRGNTFRFAPEGGQPLRTFDNVSAARGFVRQDGTATVGGVGPNPPRRVEALEHYRLVHNGGSSAAEFGGQYATAVRTEAAGLGLQDPQNIASVLLPSPNPPWVKIFERVPGATIEGQGPPNTNVTAAVRMQSPNTGQTFTYRQRTRTDDGGQFAMRVPYSTTGYANWGPENGYTNASVRAAGPYSVSTGLRTNESSFLVTQRASANVTEAQVIGEDDSPVQVTLERRVLGNLARNGNGTAGGGGDGSGSVSSDPVAVEPRSTPSRRDPEP